MREDRDDGFVQSSKRKTCNRLEKTDWTTHANRSNKFDVECDRKWTAGFQSAQACRTAPRKSIRFLTVWHPRQHPHFFAVLHPRYFANRFGQKKLVENSMFAIRFLCFFFLMFSMRVFFGASGHLPMLSKNGVAQILHMCSVVAEQHAVIPVEGSCPPETNAVSFFVLATN